MKLRYLALAALMLAPAYAQSNADKDVADVLNRMINTPAAEAWNVWGAPATAFSDETVNGGRALRVKIDHKGANPWDAAAASVIKKPVKKGDVILVAFWAKAEEPAPGGTTAKVPAISVQLNKAPYTALFTEAAEIGGKWALYYASGVADADYGAEQITASVMLAADKQTIDLGPVFVLDYGPDFDRTKLPHNKTASAPAQPQAQAAPTPAESRFASELASLRAKLPVKGVLIGDPGGPIFTYGPDVTGAKIAAPEIAGGTALRTTTSKPGEQPWSDGASMAVTGAIHKGDVVFVAAYLRAAEIPPEAQAGVITDFGVHQANAPWTPVATASVGVPRNTWRLVYASGVANDDYPAGSASFLVLLGCCKQTIDIGPVFVLDLGPNANLSALPANTGK